MEDPIEFSFTENKSMFNQREIGVDALSFKLALKVVLRQNPDIILIGEMHDRITFETGLSAAETGHLVRRNRLLGHYSDFRISPTGAADSSLSAIGGDSARYRRSRLLPALEGGSSSRTRDPGGQLDPRRRVREDSVLARCHQRRRFSFVQSRPSQTGEGRNSCQF